MSNQPLILNATTLTNIKEHIHFGNPQKITLKDGKTLTTLKLSWKQNDKLHPFYFEFPEQNSNIIKNKFNGDFIIPISLKEGKTYNALKTLQNEIQEKLMEMKEIEDLTYASSRFSLYKEREDIIQVYNKLYAYKPCIDARTESKVIIPKASLFLDKNPLKDITDLIGKPNYSYKLYAHFEQIWLTEENSAIRPTVLQAKIVEKEKPTEYFNDQSNVDFD